MKNRLLFRNVGKSFSMRMAFFTTIGLLSINSIQAQYCTSSFTSVTFEYITNVTFNTINNTTGGVLPNNNFTAISTGVNLGVTYPLSVTIDPDANDYIYAFIDWNQNGTLNDPGEVYTLAVAVGTAGPWVLNITVPNNASYGPTRMRVMVDWLNAVPNPCRSATYGEVEDYTVDVLPPVPDDAGIAEVISPTGGCAGDYDVITTVQNYGSNQIQTVTVEWMFNGVPMTPVVHSMLLDTNNGAGPNSVDITLGTVTLTAGSPEELKIWTSNVNATADISNLNDTATIITNALGVTSTFPLYEDFEGGQGDWVAGGSASSWAFGTPAKSNITGAASGINAFVTGGLGTGLYNANENSQVNSGCIDLREFEGTPWVALDIWWISEGGWDGAVLQTSVDDGITWQNVGGFGDPNNWYNDNSLDNRPGGSMTGWAGSGTNSSNGWRRAKHKLDQSLVGKLIRFRVAFGSDGSGQYDGFAFDNFTVVDFLEADLGPDRSLCGDPSIVLDPNVNFNGTIEWSTTDTTNETITAFAPGLYWVNYTDSLIDETTSDSVEIIQSVAPNIAFPKILDTIRQSESITLDPNLPYDLDFTWTPGDYHFPFLLVKGSEYGVGTHTFTLNVVDSVLCTDEQIVTVVITPITGVDEITAGTLNLYPNPVRDILTVDIANPEGNRAEVKLYDITGKMIYTNAYSINGPSKLQINMSNLNAGTYLLQIGTGENVVMKKVIKE